MAQVVACFFGNLDLRTIGVCGKATAALDEGRRRLAAAKGDEAKAAVQAAIDVIEAKARATPLHARHHHRARARAPPCMRRCTRHSMPESPAHAPPFAKAHTSCTNRWQHAERAGERPSWATQTTPTGATRKTRSYTPLWTAHRATAKVVTAGPPLHSRCQAATGFSARSAGTR